MNIRLAHRHSVRASTHMVVITTMIVVGTMLAAYLSMVNTQNSLATRSQTWNRSIAVVEAGIEDAMAHLNKNGTPDSAGQVYLYKMSYDGWNNNGSVTGPWTKQGWINGDFYLVNISTWDGSTANFPVISSTGYVQQLPAFAWKGSSGPFLASINHQTIDMARFTKRAVQCDLTNVPAFSRGLIAKHGIDLNGNNVLSDSYDSTSPLYSTNKRWDPAKRRDRGDIASNDNLTNIINIGNANIWGRVSTGPGGSVAIGPIGKVGNAAWQASSVKGIQPGYFSDDMNVEFPDVVMPAGSAGWLPPPSGSGGYTYVFSSPGDYRIASGTVTGKILVSSPNVRLRVDGGWSFTGLDGMTITTNGGIIIYLNCASASITGNGIINTAGTPSQCLIYGTTKLTDLQLGGNGDCTAVVYAPDANTTLLGGGSGVQDFSGAMVAKTFKFTGHYNVHYDESLGRNEHWRGFVITSWNER